MRYFARTLKQDEIEELSDGGEITVNSVSGSDWITIRGPDGGN